MSGRISNTICPTIKENNKYDEVKEKIKGESQVSWFIMTPVGGGGGGQGSPG